MHLKVVREYFGPNKTLGTLYIDGEKFGYTCEDTDRKLEEAGASAKIAKMTAIPRGSYRVIIDMSERFKKLMPHILAVPFFSGIRIHSGNTEKDTEGCLLVGFTRSIESIGDSRRAMGELIRVLQETKEEITITIE